MNESQNNWPESEAQVKNEECQWNKMWDIRELSQNNMTIPKSVQRRVLKMGSQWIVHALVNRGIRMASTVDLSFCFSGGLN